MSAILVGLRCVKMLIGVKCEEGVKCSNFWLPQWRATLNSLAPVRSEFDSKNVIFNLVLLIGIFRSYHDNALRWMSQDLTDDKSTLVQVMAWCRQATSHYLSQCWLSSLSPYGVARPQWVKYTMMRYTVVVTTPWSLLRHICIRA